VLQRVAVCCCALCDVVDEYGDWFLQYSAVRQRVLQQVVAACCSVLQCVALCCSVQCDIAEEYEDAFLQCSATR